MKVAERGVEAATEERRSAAEKAKEKHGRRVLRGTRAAYAFDEEIEPTSRRAREEAKRLEEPSVR